MASPIPKDVVEQLQNDPFMQQCCICGVSPCQWHHHMEFGRKAVNEAWCILPLCHIHHQGVREIQYKRLLDWCMLNKATDKELKKYSKVMDYQAKKKWLNNHFGEFSPLKLKELYASGRYKAKAGVS